MALDGCGLVCKYVLFIFNLIFAVLGFTLMGLGLWLRFSSSTRGIFEINALSSSTFVIGVTVLIVLGTAMLVMVMFGDYGACNEKRCALQVFSVLLSIMAVAEVVVGVLAYTRSDEFGTYVADFYSSMYAVYITNGDPVVGITLKFVQEYFHCCGVTGVPLVEMAKETCPKPAGIWEHIVMPNCPGIIRDSFVTKAPLVMGIFIGTGALLITAVVCTVLLLKELKRGHDAVAAYYSSTY